MNGIQKYSAVSIMIILFELSREKPKKQNRIKLDHLERYVRTNFLFHKNFVPHNMNQAFAVSSFPGKREENHCENSQNKAEAVNR